MAMVTPAPRLIAHAAGAPMRSRPHWRLAPGSLGASWAAAGAEAHGTSGRSRPSDPTTRGAAATRPRTGRRAGRTPPFVVGAGSKRTAGGCGTVLAADLPMHRFGHLARSRTHRRLPSSSRFIAPRLGGSHAPRPQARPVAPFAAARRSPRSPRRRGRRRRARARLAIVGSAPLDRPPPPPVRPRDRPGGRPAAGRDPPIRPAAARALPGPTPGRRTT